MTKLQPTVGPKQFGTFLPESNKRKLLKVLAFMLGFVKHEFHQKVSFKKHFCKNDT